MQAGPPAKETLAWLLLELAKLLLPYVVALKPGDIQRPWDIPGKIMPKAVAIHI